MKVSDVAVLKEYAIYEELLVRMASSGIAD